MTKDTEILRRDGAENFSLEEDVYDMSLTLSLWLCFCAAGWVGF